jgi:glucan phosphoethanolaminetransferase (alkaline phosphatase superfamily)
MKNIFHALFKIATIAIILTLVYFVVVVSQVYQEMKTTKPKELTDLPDLSKIWWIPIFSAGILFTIRSQIKDLIRPTFLLIGKDKEDE